MPTTIEFRRPRLYPLQSAAIYALERYSVIEASTKSGKTVGCIVWLTEQAIKGRRGQNFWWVAPIFTQAKIAFRRLKRMIPREFYTTNATDYTITLVNGAVLWFKGADKPDSLYGEDVFAAVIDEATRCKAEAWHAVRSTLTATGGPIRIIGNVKGRKNWAYGLARRAEAGAPDMHYAKITYRDAVAAGIIKQTEVDDARRQLPEAVFNELYGAEASEDAGNPFGVEAIRRCIQAAPPNTAPVVFGWDLAKSVDYMVGIGLDRHGNVTHLHRWHSDWEDSFAQMLRHTGHTPAWVDSTGVGDPVFERLRKDRPNFRAFKFTATSKQQLMEGLAVAIQQRRITFPPGVIVSELESFEYHFRESRDGVKSGVTYSAPAGLYDDCVCALALAVHGLPKYEAHSKPLSLPKGSLWTR